MFLQRLAQTLLTILISGIYHPKNIRWGDNPDLPEKNTLSLLTHGSLLMSPAKYYTSLQQALKHLAALSPLPKHAWEHIYAQFAPFYHSFVLS